MNDTETCVAEELEASGYEVVRRGWPDFLAVRGNEVRFIEVKRGDSTMALSPHQKRVAEILALVGIKVEVWSDIDAAFSESERLDKELDEVFGPRGGRR